MAAIAGALGVTLAKPGAYRLGNGPSPTADDIGPSLRLFWRAAAVTLGAMLVAREIL
jgi:cobalamin biosynthesis protein CobD/CbiB